MPTPPPILYRRATSGDLPFLYTALYHAIYVPAGTPPPPPTIVHDDPALSRYVDGWSAANEPAYLAELQTAPDPTPIAAAWLRLLRAPNAGYGYVSDATPELSISVLPAYRNQGIGTTVLDHLLAAADLLYLQISLSVSVTNPARRLYLRHGFHDYQHVPPDTLVMLRLRPTGPDVSSTA